jgi:hypothetical protein
MRILIALERHQEQRSENKNLIVAHSAKIGRITLPLRLKIKKA